MQRADAAAGRPAPPPREPPPYKPGRGSQETGVPGTSRHRRSDGALPPLRRAAHHDPAAAIPDRSDAGAGDHALRSPSCVSASFPPTAGRIPTIWSRRTWAIRSAHWEGDTLVVDVTGFNEKTWLAGVGTIHSEKLHVTERYTRDTHDTIRYEVTMEDPEVFTKPWHSRKRSGCVRTSGFASTNASRTTRICCASRKSCRTHRVWKALAACCKTRELPRRPLKSTWMPIARGSAIRVRVSRRSRRSQPFISITRSRFRSRISILF